MEPTVTLARRLWQAVEPLHAAVYFDPEPTDALKGLGMRGWWMSYFAGRFAPLGPIGAAPATAMAFGFAPRMVARALPDAWAHADPDRVLAARMGAAGAVLRARLQAEAEPVAAELCGLLDQALAACPYDGRPLAAGWLGVDPGRDLYTRLWVHATALREHRGDGHVIAAVGLGLGGLDTSITHCATGAVTRQVLQPNRGWTDEEWDEATGRLQSQGLLDGDGRLTEAGDGLRRRLEETTDRLAAAPVERLGQAGVERAIELAAPFGRHLIDTGLVPIPNPIGAPRP